MSYVRIAVAAVVVRTTPVVAQSVPPSAPAAAPESVTVLVEGVDRYPIHRRLGFVTLRDLKDRPLGIRRDVDSLGRATVPLARRGGPVRLAVRALGLAPATVELRPDTVRDVIHVTLALDRCPLLLTGERAALFVHLAGPAPEPRIPVTISVREGRFRDTATLVWSSGRAVMLARNRVGTYAVEARAAGYRIWRQEGVVVRTPAPGCWYAAATVLVRLQPRP